MDNTSAADKDSVVNFYVAPSNTLLAKMTWSATRVLCPRCAPTMNKLFEPTKVLEPSFVPLWTVQYSRMTLLSPISTPDETFGLKLRSCGKDPIIAP